MHRLRVGSLHQEQITEIIAHAPTEFTVSEVGFWKIARIGSGLGLEPIRLSYSALGIRR